MSVLTDACENTPAAWTRRAVEHAEPWAAAGWSQRSQAARFDRILTELHPRLPDTFLDYGCGTGALAPRVSSGVRYLGFDWSLGMVERAKREHPGREFTTQLRDGDTWDLVVCCGCFNLKDNWSKAQTWALVRMLWARTTRAMAVSLYCGTDPACLRYTMSEAADAVKAMPRAYRVSIETGYLPNDLLLVMRR